MSKRQAKDADGHGLFDEARTLTIRRRLRGPIARVCSYLTDSALRA